jgi:hypothetical protein
MVKQDLAETLRDVLANPSHMEGAVRVHAVGAYLNTGPSGTPILNDIRLVHWNLADVADWEEFRQQVPDSEIRLIFVYPDGTTVAESVF